MRRFQAMVRLDFRKSSETPEHALIMLDVLLLFPGMNVSRRVLSNLLYRMSDDITHSASQSRRSIAEQLPN